MTPQQHGTFTLTWPQRTAMATYNDAAELRKLVQS